MASVTVSTEDILAELKRLQDKAERFDGLVAALAEAGTDFTRWSQAWFRDYNAATEKGTARSTLIAEHALGRGTAYRTASEVIGELLEIWTEE